MKNYKNLIYALLCLIYTIIIGAGIYEHIVVWPNAYEAPPKSLSMFQGEFGLESEPFWKNIHPIALIFFIITLILNWKSDRRNFILIPFIGYVLVLAITFTYFVPELHSIVNTKYEDRIDQVLTDRASRWELLSIIRIAFMAATALLLYLGLSKPPYKS